MCCCAGGAAVGFARASFDVWGVDRVFKRDFPFPMLVADALVVLDDRKFLDLFDVVHVSPPCQEHTQLRSVYRARGFAVKEHGADMIADVRDRLVAWGGPWLIENVPNSPLRDAVLLCGSMFGLGVRRHRLFESNMALSAPSSCDHAAQGVTIGVYGAPGDAVRGEGRIARTVEEASAAMGITWMNKWADVKEAVPPVYTEFLGNQIRGLL